MGTHLCRHRAQAQKGSVLRLALCCPTLKFLLTIEQGAGHLYFAHTEEGKLPTLTQRL